MSEFLAKVRSLLLPTFTLFLNQQKARTNLTSTLSESSLNQGMSYYGINSCYMGTIHTNSMKIML